MENKDKISEAIRINYKNIALKGNQNCCCGSNDCCSTGNTIDANESLGLGYTADDLASVPQGANMNLGCGNPIAIASLKEGDTVLDLGSGGGFDCFLARQKIGKSGFAIGVDMTPEMILLSRNNIKQTDYTNIEFRLGEIEHLPVADNTVDVILSNCVINLSLDKQQVFHEAYRVLKKGGRLCISDVVATAELPEEILEDLTKYAGCIAGAESIETYQKILRNAGFFNIRFTPKDNSRQILHSWVPESNIEDYVASFIIEAEK